MKILFQLWPELVALVVVFIAYSWVRAARIRAEYLALLTNEYQTTLAIKQAIHTNRGKEPSIGEVFTVLEALEMKGLAESILAQDLATPQRGGRPARVYRLKQPELIYTVDEA